MITQETRRDSFLNQESQVNTSPLYCGEIIEMEPGQEIIIDDCSGGVLDLTSKLKAVCDSYPNIGTMKLEELNAELEDLLVEFQAGNDPNNTVYILPGGGGQRLALSLQEYGLYMPNQLSITVERPTLEGGIKGPAAVSAESLLLLTPEMLDGKDIVILDDAINAGGTLLSIREAIIACSGGTLKNKLIAAAPIRFAVPGKNGGAIEYGVPGYDAVIASKVIYGPDPDESSPVTFLSSFIKNGKIPKDDRRFDRIAEKAGIDKGELVKRFTEMQTAYRAYLFKKEGYKPEDPRIIQLAETLTSINDVTAMLNFIRALSTLSEIDDLAMRLEIAQKLDEGYSVREIVHLLGVSEKTVVRVKFWYDEHPQGYKAAFDNRNSQSNVDGDFVI